MPFKNRSRRSKATLRRSAPRIDSLFELLEKRHALSGESIVAPLLPPPAAVSPLTLLPKVQLSHFGQDISFSKTVVGVTSIPVSSGGSGYSAANAPTVTIIDTPGTGTGAAAHAVIVDGAVTAIAKGSPGSGYTLAPTVTITDTLGGTGKGATAVVTLFNGQITGYTVTDCGSGYTHPVVAFSAPGTCETAGIPGAATTADGVIQSIAIDKDGSGTGYDAATPPKVTLAGGATPTTPAVLGTVVASGYTAPDEQTFIRWANDYIQFVTNTGVSVCYINIGDYGADNKHNYDYLNPDYGADGKTPWIVTNFLDKLPAGVEAGAIAYVKDAWHLYDDPSNPNYNGNTFTTDGKTTSPPKNNVYQSFQLINTLNAAQLAKNGTKFFTHYQADGEGAGSFEADSYYAFGGVPAANSPYAPPSNSTVANTSWTWTPGSNGTPGTTGGPDGGWPIAGYGYTKWLYNHFMPGVTVQDVAAGGVALPSTASNHVPDLAYTDAEAIDATTWSNNPTTANPYQFGIIKYAQSSWLQYSPGPMVAFTENYWFGENHYVPGPGSSIMPDIPATTNNPLSYLNAPTANNTFPDGVPTITFNTPTNGTAATGYAVMGAGSIDQTALDNGNSPFFTNNGIGSGYSTGVWIPAGAGGSGYSKSTKDNLNVSFTPQAGDPQPTRPAAGYIDAVDGSGAITSITITDPGEGYIHEPTIVLPVPTGTPASPASPQVLLLPEDGYPRAVFPASQSGRQATGFVTVLPQSNAKHVGAIAGLTILDYGTGYAYSPSTVATFGALPLDPTAGGISGKVLPMNSGGSGYTSPPNITIGKPQGGIAPTLRVNMIGDRVGSVDILTSGSGYSTLNPPIITVQPQASIGYATASGPLAGPGGLEVTFDTTTTVGGPYHFSPFVKDYPIPQNSGVRVPALHAPVISATDNIASIVITGLGDHYVSSLTDPNRPYYTAGKDLTKHYVGDGAISVVNVTASGSGYTTAIVTIVPATGDTTGSGATAAATISGGRISAITVTSPGTGYTATPTLVITGEGTGAKATIGPMAGVNPLYSGAYGSVLNLAGSFAVDAAGRSLLAIIDQGSGYSAGAVMVDPNTHLPVTKGGSGYDSKSFYPVTFTGGGVTDPADQATGFANVNSDGFVTGITITNPGNGYASEPTIAIPSPGSGEGMSQAYAQAHLLNFPKVVISGGTPSGGSAASAYAIVGPTDPKNPQLSDLDTGYVITGIGFNATGLQYKTVPTVTIEGGSNPNSTVRVSSDPSLVTKTNAYLLKTIGQELGGGTTAPVGWTGVIQGGANTFNWLIPNGWGPGQVASIAMTAVGTGYTTVPAVTFDPPLTGGKNATGLAMMGLKVTVNGGGANYKTAPTVAFGKPAVGGTQATGVAVLGTGAQAGKVVAVTVTNPGSGYASAPALTFTSSDSGSGASATVSFDGTVSGIAVTFAGYGYPTTTPPKVTIGDGTQATATVTLGELQILSPNAQQTAYSYYSQYPAALAAMFNNQLYNDVALPKLDTLFYQPLNMAQDHTTKDAINGDKTPQQAIATFSIESLNRSNVVNGQLVATCLDAKYSDPAALAVPNTLGGTFAGLSSLTYEDFVTFLNSCAEIIAAAAPAGTTMKPTDVTFQIYDAAFLPLEWLTQQVSNHWTSVNERPVFYGVATGTIAENSGLGAVIFTAAATDAGTTDPERTVHYGIKPGVADAARVTIDAETGEVRLLASANYEAKKTYQFVVVATDGGSPALSAEKLVTVNVADVFELPAPPQISVPTTFPVVEDTRTPLLFSGVPFTDTDSSVAKTMTVTLRVYDGVIAARSGAGVTVAGPATARTFTGSLTALNNYFTAVPGRISYTAAANNTYSRPLTINISEAYGTFRHSSTVTSTIVIAAVNDAPRAWAPAVFRVTEDVASSLVWPGAPAAFTDVDSTLLTVTFAVPVGALAATGTPLIAVGGTANALTLSGAPADLNAYVRQPGNIQYTSALDSTAPQTLTVTASDGQLQSAVVSRILIQAVNDAPTQNAASLVIGAAKNTPFVINQSMLKSATAAADVDSKRIAFIVDGVTVGKVEKWNGKAWAALGAATPLAGRIVDAGQKLRWTAPHNAVGATAAFTVSAWDGQKSSAVSSQVWVSIAAPDDNSLIYFLDDTTQTTNVPTGYGMIGEFSASVRDNLTKNGRIVGESVALKNNHPAIGFNIWPLIKDLFTSTTPVAEADKLALAQGILSQALLYPGLSSKDEFPSPGEANPTPAGGYVFWAQDFEFDPGNAPTDEVYAGVLAVMWAGRQVLGDAFPIYPVPSSSLFQTLGDGTQGAYNSEHIIHGNGATPYLASLGLRALPTDPAPPSGGEWNFLSLAYENKLIDGFFGQQYNPTLPGRISTDTKPFYSADLPYALMSSYAELAQVATGGPWNTVYNGNIPFHAGVYWAGDVISSWGQPAPANQKLKPTQALLPTQAFGLYGRRS